jgi:acyl carrier protein
MDFPLDDITSETVASDIDAWDSLNHLSLILALEQEFGIQFTADETARMLSVDIVATIVTEKTDEKRR